MILLETKQTLLKDGMTELYKNDKQKRTIKWIIEKKKCKQNLFF